MRPFGKSRDCCTLAAATARPSASTSITATSTCGLYVTCGAGCPGCCLSKSTTPAKPAARSARNNEPDSPPTGAPEPFDPRRSTPATAAAFAPDAGATSPAASTATETNASAPLRDRNL
jgi:hypothetical protein